MNENHPLLLQCALCNYRTDSFGDLVNHPCRKLMLEQQKKRERAVARVNLDDFLFCPVCGSSRLKKHEEKRRAGGFLMMPKDHCLQCWTRYDEDWSFLDQFYCFRADYSSKNACDLLTACCLWLREGNELLTDWTTSSVITAFPASTSLVLPP